jgi:hypothetical protein
VALLALALSWLLKAGETHFDTAKKIERAEKKGKKLVNSERKQ